MGFLPPNCSIIAERPYRLELRLNNTKGSLQTTEARSRTGLGCSHPNLYNTGFSSLLQDNTSPIAFHLPSRTRLLPTSQVPAPTPEQTRSLQEFWWSFPDRGENRGGVQVPQDQRRDTARVD